MKKLNASNCHLLKMDSIRFLVDFVWILYNPSWLVRIFTAPIQRTPLHGCIYTFWKHLFFRTPESGCCCCCFLLFLGLATALFFSRNIFFKETPIKNTCLNSHFHDERKFHHCFSSFFHGYFLRWHSSRTFLYEQSLKTLRFF